MKAIRGNIVIVLLFLLSGFELFAQKDLVISGGNSVSSFVCANQKVYVWGNNKTTTGTGLLGFGGTGETYNTPQLVDVPGVDFNQVNSGSGAHFVALGCNGDVWAWGNNSKGQIGNNSSTGEGGFVATPTRVLAGVLAGTAWDDGGYLTNVDVVYAGNNNSFAILDDGRMVAWGSNAAGVNMYTNAYGQLGVGDQVDHLTPMFVLDGQTGLPLEGVVQVFAGDNAAYALVDPEGDGIGTVYSWGNGLNGTLGRNAAGTDNPEDAGAVVSDMAYPVFHSDADGGGILDNITAITCGDVFGAALDVDGYIWSWGNGGWNNATGTGIGTSSIPTRIPAGNTVGASNDGDYVLAKSIGGGQGYGMAVTIDGKPIAWGGGGCGDGGATGNGTTSGNGANIEYIEYANGLVHDDVILINRGDSWGFYGRADGSMWAWGCNEFGQLGIGLATTSSANYATKINPPTGCGFKDPQPYVVLTPGDTIVCASDFNSLKLESGFDISVALAPNYKITWKKNGTQVFQGTALNALEYTATTPGTYRVEIEYTGTNIGCSVYDPAFQEMTIDVFPTTFTAPAGLEYCGDSAIVNVNSTSPTDAVYTWYPTSSSTTVIGTTSASNSTKISISAPAATPGTGTNKIVYVEETSSAAGYVMKKAQACDVTWFGANEYINATIGNANAQSGFTVHEPVTIEELKVRALTNIYSAPGTVGVSIQFGIYGSKTVNGGFVADQTKPIGTFTADISRTRAVGDPQELTQDYTIPVNIRLPKDGVYFISLVKGAATNKTGSGDVKLGLGNCTQSVPVVDDATGTIIEFSGMSQDFSNPQTGSQIKQGHFFDVKFKTDQRFCDRVPVELIENCPCNKPKTFTLNSDDLDKTLCPGESTVLSASTAQDNTTDFDFTWYKGSVASGTIVDGPDKNIDELDFTLSDADAGLYTLLVRDQAMTSSASCWKEASITIASAPKPTYSIVGGGIFCENDVVTPVDVNFTVGTQPYEITWTGPNATTQTGITSSSYELGVDEGVYEITAIKDLYCTGDASGAKKSIVINPEPKATISYNKLEYCGSNLDVNLTITPDAGIDLTGATYKWFLNGSGTAMSTANKITGASEGSYVVEIKLNDCYYTTASVTVVKNDLPTYSITGGDTYCAGETINDVVITFTGKAPYVYDEAITGSSLSATGNTVTIANPSAGIYKVTSLTDDNGCVATSYTASTEVIINASPVAPTVTSPVTYCKNDSPLQLSANGTGTLNWYTVATNGTSSGTAPTPSTGTATILSHYVSQTVSNCEGPRAKIDVVINELPTVNITPNPAEVCSETDLVINAGAASGTSPYTYTWSGTGAAKLNNVALPSPTFNSTDATDKLYALHLEVEDSKNCKNSGDIDVQVYALPTATLSALPTEICDGEDAVITAVPTPAGGTGTWSANVTKISETTADLLAPSFGTETITYNYVSAKNCAMKLPVEIDVVVHEIPALPTVDDLTYCVNSTPSVLTAVGSNLLWYTSLTSTPGSATAPTPTTTSPGDQLFYVTQTENNCESERALITVTVNDNLSPVINASPSFSQCEGVDIKLSLTGGTFKTQVWTGTAATYLGSGTALASPTFTGAPAGVGVNQTYTITVDVTDDNGCTGNATETITVYPIPTTTLSIPTPVCIDAGDQIVTATPTPAGGTGTWSANVTKTSETTATFSPLIEGDGTHTITYDYESLNGCKLVTPETTSIVVNPKPVLTIDYPSYNALTGICNYASPIAVSLSDDLVTGTVTSSPITAALSAADGSFDPSQATAGTYVITYNYTDGNSCTGLPKDFSITVNDRPVTDISNNPTALCDYASAITLNTDTPGGTFGGPGVSGTSFDPAVATAGGPYTITYNYTNPTTKCAAIESTHEITVNHTDVPGTTPASSINTAIPSPGPAPDICAIGTDIKWYSLNDTTSAVTHTGDCYTTPYVDGIAPDNGFMKAGVYPMYATQTLNGCQSEPVNIALTITNCPVPAPDVINYHACDGDAALDVSATGTGGPLGWWLDQSSIPASPTLGDEDATGATWNGHSKTAVGVHTIFVAEYYPANSCYGPASPITIEVHNNPNPVITDPGIICSTEPSVTIQVQPGTGTTLSGTGVTLPNIWTPQFDNSVTGVTPTTLTLDATKTWGVAPDVTATCTAQTTQVVNVTHVLPPTGTGIDSPVLWGVTQKALIPDMDIVYTGATSLTIQDSTNTVIGNETDEPLVMNPTIIDAIGHYEYEVTQFLNGCSNSATSIYNIVNCPTPAPPAEPEIICEGDALPTIISGAIGSSIEWRDSTLALISSDVDLDISALTNAAYYSNPGTYTFTVSQEALDPANQLCRGPEATVTFVVNPEPVFDINISKATALCYDDTDLEITVAPTGTNTIASVSYDLDGDAAKINTSGNTGYINPDGPELGYTAGVDYGTYNYTINASVIDSKSCTSSATKSLDIQYTAPPTGTGIGSGNSVLWGFTQISTVPDLDVTYDATVGTTVTIIDSTSSIIGTQLNEPLDMNPGHIEKLGHYEYEVRQTVLGCESEKAISIYDIVNCPTPKPVPTVDNVCEGATPSIAYSNATGQNVEWRDSTGAIIFSGDDLDIATLDAQYTQPGVYKFYVSQEDFDLAGFLCRGPQATLTYTVYKLPEITLSATNFVCYGSGPVQVTPTVNNFGQGKQTDLWSINTSATISAGVFDELPNGENTATHTVEYSYTTSKSCTSTKTHDIDVQFVPVPTGVNHYSIIPDNETVEIGATDLQPTGTVHWYNTIGDEVSTLNPYQPSIPGDVEIHTYFNVKQDILGCLSEPVKVLVDVDDCPVPAPIVVVKPEQCNYDPIPEIQATINPVWLAPGGRLTGVDPEFYFYDAPTGGNKIETNTTGAYTPTVNMSVSGEHKFWVSEFNANVAPAGCESQRSEVKFTVYKTNPISLVPIDDVCEGATNPKVKAIDVTGAVDWFETTPPDPAISGAITSGNEYQPSFTATGLHTVYAVHRQNNCVSTPESVSYTIKEIPAAPQVTGAEVCINDDNIAISATPLAGGYITWYADQNKQTLLVANKNTYIPTKESDDVYTFYAAQTVLDCPGPVAPVEYTIKPRPLPPVINPISPLCDYDGNPIITTNPNSGALVRWYKTSGDFLANGDTYEHVVNNTAGTFKYKATQEVNGCEGDFSTIEFRIIAKPNAPSANSIGMCEGDLIPTFESDIDYTQWYNSEQNALDGAMVQSTSKYFTPDILTITGLSNTYYMKNTTEGLCHSGVSNVTLSVIPKPEFSIGEDLSQCDYDPIVQITANAFSQTFKPEDIVEWVINDAPYLDNGLQITPSDVLKSPITYSIGARYRYKIPNKNVYCSSDTIYIDYTLNPRPKEPIIASKRICQGNTIEPLRAFGAPEIHWKSLGTLPANTTGQTYDFLNPEALTPGFYDFEAYSQNPITSCKSTTVTASLELAPAAEPKISGAERVCEGASGERYATGYTTGSHYDWKVTNGNTAYSLSDNTAGNDIYVDWLFSGYDTLTVFEETYAGCPGYDTIFVQTAPSPNPSFEWTLPGASNIVEYINLTTQDSIWDINQKGEIVSEIIPYYLEWNYGKRANDNQIVDTVIPYEDRNEPLIVGGYTHGDKDVWVRAVNDYGCSSVYSESIYIAVEEALYVPNAFAPTNPALGVRNFQPKGFNIGTMEVWVYDVWGNIVWYSNEVENGNFVGKWDGSYNGTLLKSDSYIWKIEASFVDGIEWKGIKDSRGTYSKFGSVLLIR